MLIFLYKYLYHIPYSSWDFYTQFCLFLFISHTNGICASVSFSIFFYVYYYVCICDQCYGDIISFMWLPHSLICISSIWLCERKSFSNSIWFFWVLVYLFWSIGNTYSSWSFEHLILWHLLIWLMIHLIFDPFTSMTTRIQQGHVWA